MYPWANDPSYTEEEKAALWRKHFHFPSNDE